MIEDAAVSTTRLLDLAVVFFALATVIFAEPYATMKVHVDMKPDWVFHDSMCIVTCRCNDTQSAVDFVWSIENFPVGEQYLWRVTEDSVQTSPPIDYSLEWNKGWHRSENGRLKNLTTTLSLNSSLIRAVAIVKFNMSGLHQDVEAVIRIYYPPQKPVLRYRDKSRRHDNLKEGGLLRLECASILGFGGELSWILKGGSGLAFRSWKVNTDRHIVAMDVIHDDLLVNLSTERELSNAKHPHNAKTVSRIDIKATWKIHGASLSCRNTYWMDYFRARNLVGKNYLESDDITIKIVFVPRRPTVTMEEGIPHFRELGVGRRYLVTCRAPVGEGGLMTLRAISGHGVMAEWTVNLTGHLVANKSPSHLRFDVETESDISPGYRITARVGFMLPYKWRSKVNLACYSYNATASKMNLTGSDPLREVAPFVQRSLGFYMPQTVQWFVLPFFACLMVLASFTVCSEVPENVSVTNVEEEEEDSNRDDMSSQPYGDPMDMNQYFDSSMNNKITDGGT